MGVALAAASAVVLLPTFSCVGVLVSTFVAGSLPQLQARHGAWRPSRASRGAAAATAVLEETTKVKERAPEPQANGTTFNATLLLDGERETISGTEATFASQWTQCFASYEDASRGHVLEQWVLPDSEDSIISFNAWHQRGLEEGATRVRCGRTALKGQDILCLECVSPYQLTSGNFLGMTSSRGAPHGAGFLGSLEQCVSMSQGTGFCKSGSLNLPAGF